MSMGRICGGVVIAAAAHTHTHVMPFFRHHHRHHHHLTVHIIYDPNSLALACNNFGQHCSCNHTHGFGELLSMQVVTFCFLFTPFSFLFLKVFICIARANFPSVFFSHHSPVSPVSPVSSAEMKEEIKIIKYE